MVFNIVIVFSVAGATVHRDDVVSATGFNRLSDPPAFLTPPPSPFLLNSYCMVCYGMLSKAIECNVCYCCCVDAAIRKSRYGLIPGG